MKKYIKKGLLFILLLNFVSYINAQNEVDSLARRQGFWVFEGGYDSLLKMNPIVIAYFNKDTLDGLLQMKDKNEELRYEVMMDKGTQTGIAKTYDNKGRLIYLYQFKDSTLLSIIKFLDRGSIYEIIEFKNGLKSGMNILFHPNGKPWIKRSYIEGKLNGEYIVYKRNGKKSIIYYYKDDIYKNYKEF
ncbi:MAG: hypothetical protein NTZ33_14615 [Bacteroidetes bacterium]|nr:hypothetical protein [Bacteroidota bacterium]